MAATDDVCTKRGDAVLACGLQHAQRSLDGRPDELVLVLGLGNGKGGRQMRHGSTVARGCIPAAVGQQIGLDEFEAACIGMGAKCPAYFIGLDLRADRAAHAIARFEKSHSTMLGDEPGDPGDEHCFWSWLPLMIAVIS